MLYVQHILFIELHPKKRSFAELHQACVSSPLQGVAGNRMGGCMVLAGRAKDTIVLISGENIEPAPIEDAICVSPLIKFATVVGQDCKHLGALLVPDEEALADLAREQGELTLSHHTQVTSSAELHDERALHNYMMHGTNTFSFRHASLYVAKPFLPSPSALQQNVQSRKDVPDEQRYVFRLCRVRWTDLKV